MALTFPADTNNPYVDTTSGLKYVYNSAVGAWESAIQPPVIVTDLAPDIDLNGFLWYDTNNAAVYIRFGAGWIPLVRPTTEDDDGNVIPASLVDISPNSPDPAVHGQLWWNSALGRMFIYYIDPSTDPQWLETSPNIDGINGGITFTGPNPPAGAVEGETWFNINDQNLYVYHNGQWVPVRSAIPGVETLTATEPLFLTGAATTPTIGIRVASTSQSGALRFATQAEANAGTANNVALSPATLENILSTNPEVYIADATEDRKGIVELATAAEASAGSSTTTVVTPAGLQAALSVGGETIPTGSIMTFAVSPAPAGYLFCNGDAYSRTTYSALFSVIGITYGTGNGSTTFNVPDMRGNEIAGLSNGIFCIKT